MRIGPWTYNVPSCSGGGFYVVRLDPEHCSYPGFRRNGEELGVCKHIVAAVIADANAAAHPGSASGVREFALSPEEALRIGLG